jgi:hypothetical protein
MRQKIDISDVERATKIRAKYLRALENEEFGLLPGTTFVRSFLRTYAEYLGLDAQRLLDEYRAHHEPRDEVEVLPITPRAPAGSPGGAGPPGPSRGVLIGGAVVVLLAFFLILGITGGDDEGEPERVQTTEEQAREARSEAGEEGRGERQAQRERRRPPTVRVRVTPTAPVYVCWDRGPGTESTEIGALSEPQTFSGRRIRLNLGNPSATVTVGGEPVTLEGPGPFGLDFRPGRQPAEIPIGERPCQ